jgi:hypothetical protein
VVPGTTLEVRDGRRTERYVNGKEITIGGPPPPYFPIDHGAPETRGPARAPHVQFLIGAAVTHGRAGIVRNRVGAQLGGRAEVDRFVGGGELFLGATRGRDRASGSSTTGFAWSVHWNLGVTTSLDRPLVGSITAGIGGSGAYGIVDAAFEVPTEARVDLPGRLWVAAFARATMAFRDQRSGGSRLPLFDEFEAAVEVMYPAFSWFDQQRGIAVRLSYREALDQQLFGISVSYAWHGFPGHEKRPTLTRRSSPRSAWNR